MVSREFIESCKLEVRKYAEEHLDKSDLKYSWYGTQRRYKIIKHY